MISKISIHFSGNTQADAGSHLIFIMSEKDNPDKSFLRIMENPFVDMTKKEVESLPTEFLKQVAESDSHVDLSFENHSVLRSFIDGLELLLEKI